MHNIMDNSNYSDTWRSYTEVLLEEIALEGLDGITLELLWKRLKVNPEWKIPIDEFVEEFIWRVLISLDHVDWYELKEPRVSPPVFASTEEYLQAADSREIDVVNFSVNYYPHNLINDGNVIGSCATYNERIKVTDEIRDITLHDVISRFGNRLVLVASQSVRNFVLISHDTNPNFELSDVSYCLLERIGRSRRCGELTTSLNFMKNGANPTFYFWNKLRQRNIIKTQMATVQKKIRCTLIHLTRFYKKVPSEIEHIVLQIIKKISASPLKMCLYSEAQELFSLSSSKKITKSPSFRRCIKLCFIPYQLYYPEDVGNFNTKNGAQRLIRVLQLISENYDELLQADMENVNEDANEMGIMERHLLNSRTTISQCYHVVQETGAEGLSLIDVERKLGISKLMARMLLKTLQKLDLIASVSSDDARKRFNRFYSKDYYEVIRSKVEEQIKFGELMDTSVVDDLNSTSGSIAIDSNREVIEESDQTCSDLFLKDSSEASEKAEYSETSELVEYSELDETTKFSETNETAKRQSSTNIDKLDELSVKRCKLDDSSSLEDPFLQNQISSVLSESIKCSLPPGESLFVVRRVNIVLNYIYKVEVAQRYILPKMILDEETKRGIFQGLPAQKTVRKILDILCKSGKIKIIRKTVCNKALNKSRDLEFVCIPTVTENHSMIQAAVQKTLSSLSIVYANPQSVTTSGPIKYQPRPKSNRYGYGAKFSRMRTLHELVTYLVYHYEGVENLDGEECRKFVQPLLGDSESVDDLPTMYKKEISWKMFIPPLMPYEAYINGWIFQNDVAERLPLKLFFCLVRPQYDHPDVEKYLKHPIKQYYLMRHLPQHLQEVLSIDRKYNYALCLNFRLLCYVGVCQFGPKTTNWGFQNLVYANKTARLLDTRLSDPGEIYVSRNVDYPSIQYNLTNPGDVEAFWNDALRFSLGTKLGLKKYNSEESEREVETKRIPDRLTATVEPRSMEEVLRNDNGEIPGDKRGAAGFDSWMHAYKANQWFLNKSDRRDERVAAAKNAENPENPENPENAKPIPTNTSAKPVSKLKRFRHQVIRKREYNRSKISYDNVDLEALKNLKTLRASWSKDEDEILLLSHIASKYYSKPTSLGNYRPYILIRKILHTLSERSADKTVHACKRRIVNQLRNPLKKHNINLCLRELANDVELKHKCREIFENIEKSVNDHDSVTTKSLLDQLTEKVFYHLYDSKKINVSYSGTLEISLPDSLDTFRENFSYEYALPKGTEKYLELSSKKDVAVLLVVNLIFSSLFSQVDKSKSLNAGFLYGVFKQFEDGCLKSALHYIRTNRLVSNNKSVDRNRGLLLPFGSGMFHFSLTYHLLLKAIYKPELFSGIYNKFLELFSNVDNEIINITNYDAGLTTLLISHSIHQNVQFHVEVPDTLLLFDEAPVVIDESVMTKAVVKARRLSDTTLSLVREHFTPSKSDEIIDQVADERDKIMVVDDTLNDEGDDEEDDRLIDFSVSKISIYLTRNQFRHTDVRFSNAYDHFKLNPFTLNYCINNTNLPFFDRVNRLLFLERVEKRVSFKKIKYTTTELQQKIRKCFHETGERDFATSVMEFLLVKGLCGVPVSTLSTEFEDVQLLKNVVDSLVRKKLIIRDGSVDTRFVHINFGEHWLVLSCKKNIFVNESVEGVVVCKPKDTFNLRESTEPLWIAIRPWIHFNGTVNEAALDSFLIRILSYIIKVPALSLIGLQRKFLPALQPHCTRELLEFLELLKCIRSYIFTRKNKPSLFSTCMEYTLKDEVHGFEEEDTIIYEPLPHAFVTLAVFLSSTNAKDILETKWSGDVRGAVDKPSEVERKDVAEDSS